MPALQGKKKLSSCLGKDEGVRGVPLLNQCYVEPSLFSMKTRSKLWAAGEL